MPIERMAVDPELAAMFARWALNCINQEYPRNGVFWFEGDADVKPPREQAPAFYGCLDWHSSVHAHWLLARLVRCFPAAEFQSEIRSALSHTFTPEKIQGEIDYLRRRPFFECPYGFAWLLQLAAELNEWDDPQAKAWLAILEPLRASIARNFSRWLENLELPNRTGGHFNTAFSLGLALDWSRDANEKHLIGLIENKAREFYLNDRNYPVRFEPLGYDFVSPGLAEADLMRRVLASTDFADWLAEFLPQAPTEDAIDGFRPVRTIHPRGYLQSHFQGLNISRAWMLEGIIAALPHDDLRLDALRSVAVAHRQDGLMNLIGEHYSQSHWLGTFVVYLATARGMFS